MKPQYKMKRYLMLATLLGGLLPLQAQHQTSLFDSTSVTMEESGRGECLKQNIMTGHLMLIMRIT